MILKYFFLITIFAITFQTGIFAQSESELEFGEVTFTYKDSKTKTFDDDVLLSQTGIDEDELYDDLILNNAVTKLKKFYFDNGFFYTEIDTNLRYISDDDNISVKFIITENLRYKIDTLIYAGIESIAPEVSKKISKLKVLKS
ncbi:MAG: POTRA domain-containing protein, partial [Ignavibacteria bacterium]